MATEVYSRETILLQDGTELTLIPNNIKTQRVFSKKINELSEVTTEDGGIELLLEIAAICIQRFVPDLVKDTDKLEEALDMPTIYKIIEVCGGIKLDDPKLIAAAMEAAAKA